MIEKVLKNKRNLLIAVIALVLVVLMVIAIVQGKSDTKQGKDSYEVYVVRTQEPVITEGSSQPNQEKSYSYDPSNGTITAIHVKNGQNVKISDPLFAYHNGAIADQIEDAKTQQTRLYNKKKELQKQASIDPTIKQSIAEIDAQIADLSTTVQRLKEKANIVIYAPMEGKVILDSNKKADPAASFLKVISTTPMVVSAISEYDYYALKVDQKVRIYINAEDREIDGTVTGIDELSANNTAGGIGASSALSNAGSGGSTASFKYYVAPAEAIHVDFTVQIKIPLEDIIVPEECIVKEEEKEYVFVVKEAKAVKQEITRTKKGLQVVLTSGLALGDQVLINPGETMTDGQDVRIREGSGNAH